VIARVFPRRTNQTPTDEHAYVGMPPLWADEYEEAHVSVVFTWDLPEARRLADEWSHYCGVRIGGPALDDPGGDFEPGRFLSRGNIITSRGCPKRCKFCFVPKREGPLRELPIRDGWNVQDNNLLACSREHIEAVFEMLRRQPEPIRFTGGLDIDYLAPWHVDLLGTIRLKSLFVACDRPQDLARLDKAADLLADMSIEKKRCYVLIGYGDETLTEAEQRCEAVYRKGFLPFAMLFRDKVGQTRDRRWKRLQKKWARPAIYRGKRTV